MCYIPPGFWPRLSTRLLAFHNSILPEVHMYNTYSTHSTHGTHGTHSTHSAYSTHSTYTLIMYTTVLSVHTVNVFP